MSNDILHLAEILCWNEPEPTRLARLHERYFGALCRNLGVKLALLKAHAPRLAEKVEARLDEFTQYQFTCVLLQPATSRRIMTDLHGLEEVADYLLNIRLPAETDETGRLLGTIPIYSRFPEGNSGILLCERVCSLADSTAQLSEPVAVFWRWAMRELILCEDIEKSGFFSNSPQGYVGRAVITNGHLPIVDDVMLVEAMVHEATHGFVGMSEAIGFSGVAGATPWLSDRQPYDGISRVTSPWTGTPLDIPTYLHACFVWWGLLHFWGRMREHRFCNQDRAGSRFFRALRGFVDDAHIAELAPYRSIISSELIGVLENMSDTLRPLWEIESAELVQ